VKFLINTMRKPSSPIQSSVLMQPHSRSVISKVLQLLRGIHIRPTYLCIPLLATSFSALLEGASVSLLIPLLSGFLKQDFSFIKDAQYIGPVINHLPDTILNSDRYLFAALLSVFIVVVLFKNCLKAISAVSMEYFCERILHHLRKVLFGRYLRFGKLYFDGSSVGHHATVLTEFTRMATWPLYQLNKQISSLLSLVVYLGIMMTISWKITLVALPLFGVLHISVRSIIQRIRLLSSSIAEHGKELGKKSIEILSTTPLVKAYGTEDLEKRRYAEVSDTKAKLDFQSSSLKHVMMPLQESITLLSAVALFAVMMFLLVQDRAAAAAPSFIVYFYLVLNASSKFGTLSGLLGILASADAPLDELLLIMDDKDKFYVPGGKQTFEGLQETISLRNLTYSYPNGKEVLRNLSMDIQKGKMTAIVGPTGAGKTTVINLLMRFYDCPPGTIFIDGTDVRDFSLPSLLSKIALVSQETLLVHDTLRANITYGLGTVDDAQVRDVVERSRLSAFVHGLPQGLDTLIGDRGVKLSGGEKQRVSIARALLKKAKILILDEATSSMDTETERLIQEAIDNAIQNCTAIVIAHRLSTIQHADSIVVIQDGTCVEEGKLDALLQKKGKFFDLWSKQLFSA